MSDKTADKRAVTPDRTHRRVILAMVALCAAVFVAALDQTMVYTLMKDLMRDLGIDVLRISQAGWIMTGYFLGYTVALPLLGRLADVKGRRLMTMIALGLFMVGSALCIFLRRLDLFVMARVIQAAGGGALVPIAMGAAADMFPLAKRALVLGVVGGIAEAGSFLGPVYGPALAKLPSALHLMSNNVYWPLVFIVNIPLGLIILGASWRLLRGDLSYVDDTVEGRRLREELDLETSTPQGGTGRWWQRGQVDYAGAGLMAITLASLTVGLGTGSQTVGATNAQSPSTVNWPWLVAAAAGAALFVLYERQHQRPLVRIEFFKRPAFAAANAANLLVGIALIIGMAGISLYAQTLFGLSELGASYLLLQLMVPIPIGAVIGGWLADRVGCKLVAVIGFLCAGAGYYLVSRWSVHPAFWTRFVSLVVAGLGSGFVIGPIFTSVTSSVGKKWMTTGAALATVSRMIGMAVGLSAISSWGVHRVSTLIARSTATVVRKPGMSDFDYSAALQNAKTMDALHHVFGEFFLIAAIVIAVAVIPALFFYNHRERGTGGLPFLPV